MKKEESYLTGHEITKHPWEPDDMGGGFPCVVIDTEEIYEPKDLLKLVKKIIDAHEWLVKQDKKCRGIK